MRLVRDFVHNCFYLTAALSFIALALAGCVTAQAPNATIPGTIVAGNTTVTTGPGSITVSDPRIAKVQAYAIQFCKFLPAASFVAKIVRRSQTTQEALSTAQAICDAVSPNSIYASLGVNQITVNGFKVEGQRVR